MRLAERLLSESVLILRPDGTGQWGYWPGFEIFRLPSEEPPRETVEYGKYRFDPVVKPRVGGGDINHLLISQQHPVVYELAFPPAVHIKRIQIRFNCELFTKGAELQIAAFADRGCENCLAEATFSSRPPSQKPVVLDGLDTPRVYFRIGVNGKGTVGLYRVLMEASLDTARLELPPVPTGTSAWRVTDDEDSSHRARVVLRWRERPRVEQIWEDFEGDPVFRGPGGRCRRSSSRGPGSRAMVSCAWNSSRTARTVSSPGRCRSQSISPSSIGSHWPRASRVEVGPGRSASACAKLAAVASAAWV